MSTKTTFKRIALVAVAALGFGMLSVVPSNAAAQTNLNCTTAYTVTDGGVCTGVAGPANFVTITATNAVYAVITGGTFTDGTTAKSLAAAGTANVATPTAGTITVKGSLITSGVAASSATDTITITVGTANAGLVDAATSTSILNAGATWSSGTSDSTVVAAKAQNATPVAVAKVVLGQQNGAITTSTAVTASISGVGTIVLNNENDHTTSPIGSGRSLSSTIAATGETFYVLVQPDGNSGVGTLTITAGAYTTTETVTFAGSAAAYTATQTRKVYAVSSFVNQTAGQTITVAVKDAAGVNVVDGTTVYASSATTSVATIGASATTVSGVATFTVTGVKAGTSVISFGNAASSATVTTTTTIAVGSSTIAAVKLALDKTSYLPGEIVKLTVSATSSDGLPVADGTYTVFSTALSSTMAFAAGSLNGTALSLGLDVVLSGGANTATLNAPISENTFVVSGNDSTSAKNAISATAVVENAAGTAAALAATDAAAEAIDAANAATDAANAAAEAADAATAAAQDAADAVAALSVQVSEMIDSLKKQITALTNLVIKIQKKVKA